MQAELFRDRTAIVTGGARGIGLACAAKITAGGGRVALWDRDIERARQSAAALKGMAFCFAVARPDRTISRGDLSGLWEQ